MNRLKEVKSLLTAFSEQHLNEELLSYTFNLCDLIEREQGISNSRSKTNILAAAIVYVIARLNFLYDKENEYFLTTDTINEFFNTKKTTASNKASEIEKTYNINFGEEGLCNPEISDALTFIELPNGFVVPLNMLKENGIIEDKEYKERQEEKQRIKDQKYQEKKEQLKKQREEKRQKELEEAEKNQLSLFDDL